MSAWIAITVVQPRNVLKMFVPHFFRCSKGLDRWISKMGPRSVLRYQGDWHSLQRTLATGSNTAEQVHEQTQRTSSLTIKKYIRLGLFIISDQISIKDGLFKWSEVGAFSPWPQGSVTLNSTSLFNCLQLLQLANMKNYFPGMQLP